MVISYAQRSIDCNHIKEGISSWYIIIGDVSALCSTTSVRALGKTCIAVQEQYTFRCFERQKLHMTMESATGLYRSIHAQPRAVRELLADWDGPSRAAEKLSRTG